MARLHEIAEGLAAVLQMSYEPEPLGVDLVGHSPIEVTVLIRAIIDACQRRCCPLSLVRVGSVFASNVVRSLGPDPLQHDGIRVEVAADLDYRIELYRFPVA